MTGILARRNGLIALAATLALLAQAFFAGWALAANADRPMLDSFGNPLCISSDDGHGPAQTGMPNCCTFGCGPSAAFTPAPAGDVTVLRQRPPLIISFASPRLDVAPAARPKLPGSPRAPPALSV